MRVFWWEQDAHLVAQTLTVELDDVAAAVRCADGRLPSWRRFGRRRALRLTR